MASWDSSSGRAARLALGAALVLFLPGAVAATTCDELCDDPGPGTCIVNDGEDVTAGSDVDCGSRSIVVQGQGSIQVHDGFFTLRAQDLTVENSRKIEAERSPGGPPVGMTIYLKGGLYLTGVIKASSNDGGGTIAVHADGPINVYDGAGTGDGIAARGLVAGADGGSITVTSGGNVYIDDPFFADMAGGSGAGSGGEIVIAASGNVTANKPMETNGRNAEGGVIRITAGGSVDINGTLKSEGQQQEGDGGVISLTASNGLTIDAALSAQGGVGVGGGDTAGGAVYLEAGLGGIAINAGINVTGGASGSGLDGGAIVADSGGNLTVASGILLNTKSDANGGDGGAISLTAGGALTLGANTLIDARGHTNAGGSGASVELEACTLSIASGAMIDVTGYEGGNVRLTGRQSLAVNKTSVVDATGTAAARNGTITLSSRVFTPGTCTNRPTLACYLNPDCTVGCEAGECLGANPDTGGVTTQCTPPAERIEDRNLVPCD
jgi:hypothetical protein